MELKLLTSSFPVSGKALLIVPYGIETAFAGTEQNFLPLLIVPYGIETAFQPRMPVYEVPFNRTLWN